MAAWMFQQDSKDNASFLVSFRRYRILCLVQLALDHFFRSSLPFPGGGFAPLSN